MRRSVKEVEETLLIAFTLVALIIYLLLCDWRSTLIPVIAIPVSIVSAFFIMYLAHFSINMLTLVGVLLAIGLVCDDAIVVLENIYTKVEAGMSPRQAALLGSREIYFAVISTTVTLAAVFVRSRGGRMVSLDNMIRYQETISPPRSSASTATSRQPSPANPRPATRWARRSTS